MTGAFPPGAAGRGRLPGHAELARLPGVRLDAGRALGLGPGDWAEALGDPPGLTLSQMAARMVLCMLSEERGNGWRRHGALAASRPLLGSLVYDPVTFREARALREIGSAAAGTGLVAASLRLGPVFGGERLHFAAQPGPNGGASAVYLVLREPGGGALALEPYMHDRGAGGPEPRRAAVDLGTMRPSWA